MVAHFGRHRSARVLAGGDNIMGVGETSVKIVRVENSFLKIPIGVGPALPKKKKKE